MCTYIYKYINFSFYKFVFAIRFIEHTSLQVTVNNFRLNCRKKFADEIWK